MLTEQKQTHFITLQNTINSSSCRLFLSINFNSVFSVVCAKKNKKKTRFLNIPSKYKKEKHEKIFQSDI